MFQDVRRTFGRFIENVPKILCKYHSNTTLIHAGLLKISDHPFNIIYVSIAE